MTVDASAAALIGLLQKRLNTPAAASGPSSDFELSPTTTADRGALKGAAVLIPLRATATHGLEILLTVRPPFLRDHAGQIAFPGGKIDASDISARHAALREAHEEIGLPPEAVTILGALPNHQTVTAYDVHPVIGLIAPGTALTPAPAEVSELFALPLRHLAQENFITKKRIWQGKSRGYYALPYGPYYIWGATARMLLTLARLWPEARLSRAP